MLIVEPFQSSFQADVMAFLREELCSQNSNLIIMVDGKGSSIAAYPIRLKLKDFNKVKNNYDGAFYEGATVSSLDSAAVAHLCGEFFEELALDQVSVYL